MLSIFATRDEARAWGKAHGQPAPKRPLAEATLRRIARGVLRYVVEAAEPFVVHLTHHGRDGRPIGEPLATVTGAHRGEQALVAPFLVPRYGERDGQDPRVRSIDEPLPVVVPTGNGASLCAAFLARHWGGMVGKELREPHPTVLTKGAQDQLVVAHLMHQYTSNTNGGRGELNEPLRTVTTGGHHALIYSFLAAYYGTEQHQGLSDPLATITTHDRFGLVTVTVAGQPYVIVDIAMRMLQPHELYRAQGFPPSYVIDRGADGRRLTKTEQVRMVGNSVCPPIAAALAAVNVPELRVREWAVA